MTAAAPKDDPAAPGPTCPDGGPADRVPPSRSLHAQLMRQLMPALLVVWIAVSVFIAWRSADELTDNYGDQLDQLSHSLVQLLDARLLTAAEVIETVRARRDRNFFVIVYSEGRLVLRSPKAPAALDPGDFDDTPEGLLRTDHHLISLAQTRDGSVHVIAGMKLREIDQLVRNLLWGTMLPMALMLAAMLWVIHRAIRRSLRPLDALRHDLAGRSHGDLHPVDREGLPSEVVPVVQALNLLLAQMARALEAERRFVADASHELRTPLTAIRAQAETIDRSGLDPAVARALERIVSGVGRATRLSQQLLRLARADAAAGPEAAPPPPIALLPVVEAVVSELFPLAVREGVELEVLCRPDGGQGGLVQAGREDLEMILCNLVENAILHGRRAPDHAGPEHAGPDQAGPDHAAPEAPAGIVRVSCGPGWLEVADDGPGIDAGLRPEMFARFRRGASPSSDGAGLGLSIVAAVAARIGARIRLSGGSEGGRSDRQGSGGAAGGAGDLRGLRVRLEFPPVGS